MALAQSNKLKRSAKKLDPDPDKRIWEYDGDGKRIYKENQGFSSKRLYTRDIVQP